MSKQKVLVTGASGLVAKFCIAELIRQGYDVRATVRNKARVEATRRGIESAGADPTAVEFVEADLLSDNGWDAATAGCRFVQHVASPFPLKNPRNADEVIRPAREGTLRVLKAAHRSGVARVVLTSSIVAVSLPWPEAPAGHVFDENDWSNPERPDVTPYVMSKTLAERAAWDFVNATPGAPELAVVNPGFVLGPAPDGDLSTSHEVVRLMGKGAYPVAPKVGFPVSDVRDVAATHALAMTHEQAKGQRFLSANGFLRLYELGQIIGKTLPDIARKMPRGEMPDGLVRVLAFVDRRLNAVKPELGFPRPVSNAKAKELLGQSFRSAEEATVAASESLRKLGII
ncbi:NAD-dependent epimerase/dehydratase family protein [Hyphomicrobium sulfonivorans]|uniref:NAD-dependent epimerase/dehydratase family protein n=1 Tax=Hyphomicrobium sulfonivorans TaxID=121290 RepID=UPI00156D6BA2|nr:NAD-dependent epimerase/dehydratase family protein [Hyphomicrobium sulfonivorans]MBI1650273.1 NAD-dependent epimerase/dehydratase family protein [Hyphomicrobium sulfonivorans]NSL72364.1 epimerase [Hyphomicrobium sulfonivorans]